MDTELELTNGGKVKITTDYGFGNRHECTHLTVTQYGETHTISLQREDIYELINILARQL